MKHQNRDVVRLKHMLDAATKAITYFANKSRKDLETDEILSLALVRLIEVIGEAASKIKIETQIRHSSIEWRDIIGTRNRLIHAYEAVNLDILYQIVNTDLPILITKLRNAIEQETKTNQGNLL